MFAMGDKIGYEASIFIPLTIARLINLLKTYPLPVFSGITPSAIRKLAERPCSAIILLTISISFVDKLLDEMSYLIFDKCSINTSVLYTVLLFVRTAKVLSSPMPVSMLLKGRGVSLELISL